MLQDHRVLYVQGAGVRAGAERALLARIHDLAAHGIEPSVAILADGPFRAELEGTGVRIHDVSPVPRLGRPGAGRRALAELTRLAREHADVVEGCGEKMAVLAGWAARRARRPCVFNYQDEPMRDPRSGLIQLAGAAARPAMTVVPSRWMRDALPRRLFPRTTVIPNALVLDDLPTTPGGIRDEVGWPSDAMVVGLFARLVAWKGADVLLRAASRLTGEHPDLRFLIAGGSLYGLEPGFRAELERTIVALGLEERVILTGHREDALALMLDCDIVCHCSREPEPFGMVIVEAMALGRALVASSAGAPGALVDNGRTGLLVEPGDPGALAHAIARLAVDELRRRQLGEAGRVEAQARFSSGGVAGTLAALYRDLAQ